MHHIFWKNRKVAFRTPDASSSALQADRAPCCGIFRIVNRYFPKPELRIPPKVLGHMHS